ncbi:MAG: DUF2914 domain-containing protein [Deltaproteobacteria bacterium]|nr:DUF2914 domain-containing protein [Deltaproteobacteria bacterium]
MSTRYCPKCSNEWFGIMRKGNRCPVCGSPTQRSRPPKVPVDENTIRLSDAGAEVGTKEIKPMKASLSVVAALVMAVCIFQTSMIQAQEAVSLEVTDAAICEDVVDRAPVNAGTTFNASVGKLYCFTRITGALEPTTVTHVWYFGEMQRAGVVLAAGSANWRTKSSKIIQPHEWGPWHVDVLGPDGELLSTIPFEIKP